MLFNDWREFNVRVVAMREFDRSGGIQILVSFGTSCGNFRLKCGFVSTV